ncbi:MAG TPA: protein kinase [Candidatus Angelobacter sp.]|nr:protein kinase [Candidatus Angelobacter sp.]
MSLERIGRYEIVGELGRGAMGVVYKATDPNIGRTVALKTMRVDVHGLESADLMRRFKNEARAAGLLNHPNIVTIYDAGEHDGVFYIAMECLEGTTLQELLAERRMEPAEVVRFSQEISKGLDYAHSHGIVHRDVKPANIMITRSGTVKIMDFGIAKAGGSMTGTGQVLGTPSYMSPEQVKGKSLDGRADLFSLGVILYEMLTAEKPFAGQNVTTIIYKIVNENPIPPRELDATIPAALSALVIKALAKSPDERYQSGVELARDLEAFKQAGSRPAPAVQPSTVPAAALAQKTVALPVMPAAGSAGRTPAPATVANVKTAVAARKPSNIGLRKRRGGMIAAWVVVLLLGSVAGAFAYYRTYVRPERLVAVKNAPAQVPQAQPQPTVAVVPTPTPTPVAQPNPVATETPEAAPTPAASPLERPWLRSKKPAPTPTPLGQLAIASQPAGAKVSIDGRNDLNWVTPFTASRLIPGNHTLVFSKDGYNLETRNIESLAGKSVSFSVDLTAVFKAAINSNPSGASIFVDGEDSGQLTPAQLTLEKRLHHITVRKAGYRDASTDASQAMSFSPVLLSSNQASEPGPSTNMLRRFFGTDSIPEGKGLIHVRTVPDGATIVVDGHVAPKKSNARWPADPGIYSIELHMPGYKAVHRNIKVEAGKIGNVDEILERQ